MELYHYQALQGNVGDDLNRVLWPRVFGESLFTQVSSERFIGIGSVLDSRHPRPTSGTRHVVFGAGLRSRRSALADFSIFDIRFVRGPLSAEVIGGETRWISDSAIIAPLFLPEVAPEPMRGRIGFVPYFQTDRALQERLAAEFDLHLVSTSLTPEAFVRELRTCSRVICEAMHGAILADAYRVPWTAVRLSSGVCEGRTSLFKWKDWMMSLSLREEILGTVPSLALFAPRGVRRVLAGYARSGAMRVMEQALGRDVQDCLSDDTLLKQAQERILEEVERFRRERKL